MCEPVTAVCVWAGLKAAAALFGPATAIVACGECASRDDDGDGRSCARCGAALIRLATGFECPHCD